VGARNFDGVRWVKMFANAKGFMKHPLAPDRTALDLLFARHKSTNKYTLQLRKISRSQFRRKSQFFLQHTQTLAE
jgi:hypothetical protein